jgi:hypothetical protein
MRPTKRPRLEESKDASYGELPGEAFHPREGAVVNVKDAHRYVPPGYKETAEGYEAYVRQAADLAKKVYTRPTEIGNQRPNVDGFKYFPDSGDSEAFGVWIDETTGHGFVVFKGTDTRDEWLFQNTSIAKSEVDTNQFFQDAYDFYKTVVAKYPEITFDVTGHSLGGAKAMYVAAKAEEEGLAVLPHSITFNPGVGPGVRAEILKRMGFDEWAKKFLRYPNNEHNLIVRNADDIVSAFYPAEANTITYTNPAQGLHKYNPFWKKQQHSINQFTTDYGARDNGSLKEALERSYRGDGGMPPPRNVIPEAERVPPPREVIPEGAEMPGRPDGPFYDIPLDDIGIEQVGVDGAVLDVSEAVAETATSMMFFPLEVLNMMQMQQQADELGSSIRSEIAWGKVSGWKDIARSTHYNEPFFDSMFEWMEPKRQAAVAKENVKQQVTSLYNSVLPYEKEIFGDRAAYDQYLKDQTLGVAEGTNTWHDNFNVISKAYAKIQQQDNPSNPNFFGTSTSTQDMGNLLAYQYSILMEDERALTPVATYADGSKEYGRPGGKYARAKPIDQDGFKAVMGAVARKHYVDDYHSKHNIYGSQPYKTNSGLYNNDEYATNIPTYDASYWGMMNKWEDIPSTRQEMDRYAIEKKYAFENKPVNPHAAVPRMPKAPTSGNTDYGKDELLHGHRGDTFNWEDRLDIDHLAMGADHSFLTKPHGNAGSGTTPTVTPPSKHPDSTTPRKPNSDAPSWEDRADWEKQIDAAHDFIHHGHNLGPDDSYLNHDVNNPVHDEGTSISSAAAKTALSMMTHSRSMGSVTDLHTTGMNFAGLVQLSDQAGQAAEKTANTLAD